MSISTPELIERAHVLANALGALIVATDGKEELRAYRQDGLDAMKTFEEALQSSPSSRNEALEEAAALAHAWWKELRGDKDFPRQDLSADVLHSLHKAILALKDRP